MSEKSSAIPDKSFNCPHCGVCLFDQPNMHQFGADAFAKDWELWRTHCPSCRQYSFRLGFTVKGGKEESTPHVVKLVWPRATGRPPVPPEVTDQSIADDYSEACLVLQDSPKASAALSRRCLQHIIHKKFSIKCKNLSLEIQKVIDDKLVPSYLMTSLDAVRNIGNFAAHPQKSIASGEIVPVEPKEAEWNLEVIELLFDFVYVQPSLVVRRSTTLNVKLADLNKPPLKAVGAS